MKIYKSLALVVALCFGLILPAQALSFGVGIGFGRNSGWGGGIYTDIPASSSKREAESELDKSSQQAFLDAGIIPERLGADAYRISFGGTITQAEKALIKALTKQGFESTLLRLGEGSGAMTVVFYMDDNKETLQEMEKIQELALVLPSRLVICTYEGKTYILFEDMVQAAKDMRNGKVDVAKGMQLRLTEVLIDARNHLYL